MYKYLSIFISVTNKFFFFTSVNKSNYHLYIGIYLYKHISNFFFKYLERKAVKETNHHGTPPPASVRTQTLKESKLKNLDKEKTKSAYNSSKNGKHKK